MNEADTVLKQAEEARRLASRAIAPEHAKACLQLARDFERLAAKLRRLEHSGTERLTRSGNCR